MRSPGAKGFSRRGACPHINRSSHSGPKPIKARCQVDWRWHAVAPNQGNQRLPGLGDTAKLRILSGRHTKNETITDLRERSQTPTDFRTPSQRNGQIHAK
jgi:hypothetical protein